MQKDKDKERVVVTVRRNVCIDHDLWLAHYYWM